MSRFNELLNKKAVALTYDEDKKAAPVIVASGMGYVAERMIEVANEHGVPVYEDNSLATMLTQLELGSEIPEELYQAIVEIYIYFLNFVPGERKENVDSPEEEEAPDSAADPEDMPAAEQTEEAL